MAKTTFFLGAGATKAVCKSAPLNNDLVAKALARLPKNNELWEFIEKDLFKRKDPPASNQIWDLFDYILQDGRSASSKYSVEKIYEMKNQLLNLCIQEFESSLKNLDDDQSYRKFVSIMAESSNDFAIISTNYDIVIDNALTEIQCFNYGEKIRYAISGTRNRNYTVSGFKRPDITGETRLNDGHIKLLKIHGSLNWLYCRKCDEIDLTIRDKGTIGLLTGLHCCVRECTGEYESLLITPTMFKNYENRFIKKIWQLAEKELIESDHLVFIGYSLKEDDYQIRCLLMKALLNRIRPYDSISIVEIDPKTTDEIEKTHSQLTGVEKRYKDLYGNINFKPIGFAQYVEELKTKNSGI